MPRKPYSAASIIATAMLLPAPAGADHHFDADADDSIDTAERGLARELTDFLADYAAAYNNQDYRTVKSLWLDDGNPVYLAEEVPFPLYGDQRLGNYFNPVPGRRILDGIENRYSEVRAKYLAPDLALATYRLDYTIKLLGPPAMRGWDRVMAVFAKTPDGWRLSAYAEAPMGPATMVRKMMQATPARDAAEQADYETTQRTIRQLAERAVDPGFADFLAERADLEPGH